MNTGKNFVCQVSENTRTQMMSYIIGSNGKIAVIDGGNLEDGEKLFDTLCQIEKTDRPTVDAWLFTHAHSDHLNAFVNIMTERADKITVKNVFCNLIDLDFYISANNKENCALVHGEFFEQVYAHIPESGIHIVNIGDKIELGEAYFEVMYIPENKYINDIINNSTVVYMLNMCGQKVLFLGDLGVEAGNKVLEMYRNGELKADFVQMAHHGQNGVTEEFYKEVSPKACLWPTPLWLWNNDVGDGYNTYLFRTVIVRGWMDELGVKEHYNTFNGTCVIDMPHEFKQ